MRKLGEGEKDPFFLDSYLLTEKLPGPDTHVLRSFTTSRLRSFTTSPKQHHEKNLFYNCIVSASDAGDGLVASTLFSQCDGI